MSGIHNSFVDACSNGRIEDVKSLLELEEQELHNMGTYNSGISKACRNGHIELVKFLFTKPNIDKQMYNIALYHACRGAHKDIIKFTIENGATDWSNALVQACYSGSVEVVSFFVTRAKYLFQEALGAACNSGSVEIVNIIIENYQEEQEPNWSNAFYHAVRNRRVEVVKYIFEKVDGLKTTIYPNYRGLVIVTHRSNLMAAFMGGSAEIVNLIFDRNIKYGIPEYNYDISNTWNMTYSSNPDVKFKECLKKYTFDELVMLSSKANLDNEYIREHFAEDLKKYTTVLQVITDISPDLITKCIDLYYDEKIPPFTYSE
jgi:ankyrin repeat protein